MLAAAAEAAGQETQEFLDTVAELSPNGRITTPEEIAGLTLFLASDAAIQITGTAIPMDGGLAA